MRKNTRMGRRKGREIILASGSPKRAELLRQIGFDFRISVSGCSEDMSTEKDPQKLARTLAEAKANCVVKRYPGALIIAADTFGVIGNTFYGKPKDAKDAKRILMDLNGKMHTVVTGVAIVDGKSGKKHTFVSRTKVWFRRVGRQEVGSYIASGEWQGKGAGYTLFGRAGAFIKRVEGEVGTILGLPLCALTEKLAQFGIHLR